MPEPLRSRILMEIAADLEGAAEHYRRRGMSEGEAIRLALERFDATPEALDTLIRLYTTGLARIGGRIAACLRSTLSVVMLSLGFLPILGVAVWAVAFRPPPASGSTALWIVVLLGGLAVVLVVARGTEVVWPRHPAPRIRRAIFDILFAGLLAGVVGAAGFAHGLRRVALELGVTSAAEPTAESAISPVAIGPGGAPGMTEHGAPPAADDPEATFLPAVSELADAAVVFVLGLLVAIGAGLIWMVLLDRVERLEREEVAFLLGSRV